MLKTTRYVRQQGQLLFRRLQKCKKLKRRIRTRLKKDEQQNQLQIQVHIDFKTAKQKMYAKQLCDLRQQIMRSPSQKARLFKNQRSQNEILSLINRLRYTPFEQDPHEFSQNLIKIKRPKTHCLVSTLGQKRPISLYAKKKHRPRSKQ